MAGRLRCEALFPLNILIFFYICLTTVYKLFRKISKFLVSYLLLLKPQRHYCHTIETHSLPLLPRAWWGAVVNARNIFEQIVLTFVARKRASRPLEPSSSYKNGKQAKIWALWGIRKGSNWVSSGESRKVNMNIFRGINRLEIVLFVLWTAFFVTGLIFKWEKIPLLQWLAFWLGGIGVIGEIAWVLKGFFGRKDQDW